MVRWIRTARISKGRFRQAVGWAKEVAGYVHSKHKAPPTSVFVDSFGDVGTIRWIADFDDLASMETTMGAVMQDADYWKLVDEAMVAELFIDGKTHDLVMRQV